jgi:phosphoribosylformylglycinamidine synthase
MRAAVVVFPGTNCDRDTFRACEHFGWEVEYIWHDSKELDGYDVIFLPEGFPMVITSVQADWQNSVLS